MRRISLAVLAAAGLAAASTVRPPGGVAEPADLAATLPATQMAALAVAVPDAVTPEVQSLRQELDRLIRSPNWGSDEWGVLVVSLDHGDTLFAHEADRPLTPASNMKLVTSAAALYYLGPDFRYSTYLMTDGTVRDSVLHGDVVVYGTGDPTISNRLLDTKTEVWEMFADSLAARGIREIRGSVVGDGSYFKGPGVGEGWRESYITASYAAPAGALSYAENMVTLRVTPAEQAGWRPNVQLVPGGEGIAVVNQATTVARGRTAVHVDKPAYDAPIVLRGQIARGASAVWRATPVSDPARYAAATLSEVLEESGIRVSGEIRSVDDPAASPVTGRSVFAPAFDSRPPLRVVAVHRSPPMREILHVLNHKSHNLYAEQVLRTVGRVAVGEGSVEGGVRAVHHMLGDDSTELDMVIYDGSGLSPLNRTSPEALVRLLDFMAESELYDEYVATLPEAGDPRGLRRMGGTAAAGNLRAKTGTIDNVSALAGYVTAANGERLAFSIISNGVPSTWRAKRIEDAIGIRLAGLSRPVPAPTETAPQPQQTPAPGAPAESADTAKAAAPPSPAPAAPQRTTPKPATTSEPAPSKPAESARTHKIRRGDTLDGIAKRYGTTVSALRKANPGLNPRRLMPGKTVRLP